MKPPAVETRGLGKRYGKNVAVHPMEINVPWGTILGVIGPNGCGKTTLMRMIAGRLKPSRGGVHVGGVASHHLDRKGPRIGYMPQNGGLYPELTIAQNVRFFATAQGIPRHQRRAAVHDALRSVDLVDRGRDRIQALSGGLKRRASMACALVHQPRFLLLDEPTVGVDPEIRAGLWDTMQSLRDHGATILVSTHYLGEATRCDEVLLMRKGHVLARAPPQELMRRTGTTDLEDAFVATLEGRR